MSKTVTEQEIDSYLLDYKTSPKRSEGDELRYLQHLQSNGYWCVVCGRFLVADEDGIIVHDPVPHPDSMAFDEDLNPQ